MSTPQTTIRICAGVPLSSGTGHTLKFQNAASQQQYFLSKVVKTFSGYTYARRTWKLKVDHDPEQAKSWNYLFYVNGSGKIMYYYVDHVEYINDHTVEITISLDVLQTYQFDWRLMPCFIERQHTTTDALGENTMDEGLDPGELISTDAYSVHVTDWYLVIAATIDLSWYTEAPQNPQIAHSSMRDNTFTSFEYFAMPMTAGWAANWDALQLWLNDIGKIDAIFAVWQMPGNLLSLEQSGSIYKVRAVNTPSYNTQQITAPASLAGYTPKNKKLLQYPYSFLFATNNNGGGAVYRWEYFTNLTAQFTVNSNLAPDANMRLTPINYKNLLLNHEESLPSAQYPQCPYNADPYKLWLAQNQNQNTMSFGMGALNIVAGAATIVATSGAGAAAGAAQIAGGLSSVFNLMAQRADMEVIPPQAKGVFSGSYIVRAGIFGFGLYSRCIDAAHARSIDDYFSMYGYAIRRVQAPVLDSRQNWTYIKTIGSHATGDIPNEDLNEINRLFDAGLTWWRNPYTFGDYSQSNRPLSEVSE